MAATAQALNVVKPSERLPARRQANAEFVFVLKTGILSGIVRVAQMQDTWIIHRGAQGATPLGWGHYIFTLSRPFPMSRIESKLYQSYGDAYA